MADEDTEKQTFIRIPNQLIWEKLEVIDDGVKALLLFKDGHDKEHTALLKRVRSMEYKVNTVMAAATTLLGGAALALVKSVLGP